MIFKDKSITFQEFAMDETAPLASIQECVLEFLCDRDDAAVFGAQAVNAYVNVPRMSQGIDILSLEASALAEEIRILLNERFNIAARIREVADGRGYRIYQVRKPANRHLVDVREVKKLPPCERHERILIPTPPQLISQKVISLSNRSKTAKGMTDLADIRRLLLTFPKLKVSAGDVRAALESANATAQTFETWEHIVAEEIEADDEESGY